MEEEGVIKFRLQWQAGPAANADVLRPLEDWRRRLHAIDGIGANPQRYGGIGYGNLSRRSAGGFWITGTQTGGLDALGPEHYSLVEEWDLAENFVRARGPAAPSSESLSHAALYAVRADIHWVFHAHLPELWRQASQIGLPQTPAAVAYGTPEMALAVQSIAADTTLPLVLSMAGHEDGILAAGRNAEDCGNALLRALARAAAL